ELGGRFTNDFITQNLWVFARQAPADEKRCPIYVVRQFRERIVVKYFYPGECGFGGLVGSPVEWRFALYSVRVGNQRAALAVCVALADFYVLCLHVIDEPFSVVVRQQLTGYAHRARCI